MSSDPDSDDTGLDSDPTVAPRGAQTVEADAVRVRLGGESILDGVSLSVARGELVGLIGPNGAGKTTLLHTLTGTLTPEEGRCLIDGQDVHALDARASSRLVAAVPQNTSFSFEFTVEEAVEMGRTPYVSRFGRLSEADRQAIQEAMARTQIATFADRSVMTLSGGERQRVLLARALAQDTPALLLDEPTASLDINHQVRTFRLVREAVADGKAVLAAIHDLNLAARFCDRLVLLADGQIRADGPPEAVLGSAALEAAFGVPTSLGHNPTTDTPIVTAHESAHGDDGLPGTTPRDTTSDDPDQ